MTAAGTRRREFLQGAALMLGAFGISTRAATTSCASSEDSDGGLRKSLHYVESAPNPAERCVGCSFFSDPKGDCGSCAILSGPANQNGHCDSWSKRS